MAAKATKAKTTAKTNAKAAKAPMPPLYWPIIAGPLLTYAGASVALSSVQELSEKLDSFKLNDNIMTVTSLTMGVIVGLVGAAMVIKWILDGSPHIVLIRASGLLLLAFLAYTLPIGVWLVTVVFTAVIVDSLVKYIHQHSSK